MTSTKTITTAEGTVKYEVVTCNSCEQEVSVENTQDFVMGDIRKIQDWSTIGKIEYAFRPGCDRGYICNECVEEEAFLGVMLGAKRSYYLSEFVLVVGGMMLLCLAILLLIL